MTSTTAWIRPLTEAAAGLPGTRREVRGSRCRTSQDLFAEWAAGLGFPDHFGHNWDAFRDCLHDAGPVAVVVREAGDLLADEPDQAFGIFLSVLSEAAGGAGAGPRLLLLLDDTSDRLADVTHRIEALALDLC